MVARERVQIIKSQLERDQQVSVSQLSASLGVTEETIRRDLEKLERVGFLKRTYGGAILHSQPAVVNTPFHQRSTRRIAEKRIVAQNALKLLDGTYALAADSSTTVLECIKLVRDRHGVSVLTNSVAVINELLGHEASGVSTGGLLDTETLSFTGLAAKESLSRYRVDVVLFSCKGLDLASGIFDSREADADIKRALFRQGNKRILLADHTKFDRTSFVHLVDFDQVDCIVTDREPSKPWLDFCDQRGIELVF